MNMLAIFCGAKGIIIKRILKRKFGKLNVSSVPRPLEDFLDIDTWEESRRILEQHPELLSDQIDTILNQMIEFYKIATSKKGRTVEGLEMHRSLLQRCKQIGIEAAFTKFTGQKKRSLETVLRMFFYADSIEDSEHVVEKHPEILTEEAEALIGQAVGIPLAASVFDLTFKRRSTLRRCREVGIEQAFKELEAFVRLQETIKAFLSMCELDVSRQLVREHPEFLSEDADLLIEKIIRAIDDPRVTGKLNDLLVLLRNCRRVGIMDLSEEQNLEIDQHNQDSLNDHLERAETFLKGRLYHHALSAYHYCASRTHNNSLFCKSLLGLSECFEHFGQVFPAWLIVSYCRKLSSLTEVPPEINDIIVNRLSSLENKHKNQLEDYKKQLKRILDKIFGVKTNDDITNNLFYLSTTIEKERPTFPLFHSFGAYICLVPTQSNKLSSTNFKFTINLFDFSASQGDIRTYYEVMSKRFDDNCYFPSDQCCFGRGENNNMGVILDFERSKKRDYGLFLRSILPPFKLTEKIGGKSLGDLLPGSYTCISFGMEEENIGNYSDAETWYALGGGAASKSQDLETTLFALVNFARVRKKMGDVETASRAISDINTQQRIHNFPYIGSLIADGALEKIPDSITKRPIEKFPAIEAPTSGEMPKGFNYGSNKREFHVLVDLCEGWNSEFSDFPPPLSSPILLSQPDIFQDGLMVVEHSDRVTSHRLSKFENLEEFYNKRLINAKKFAQNLFGTIRIAHRILFGSFTDEAGSGLSPSNVTLNGEIKDFETFHSERYGDPQVTDNYYVEDLRLAIEALKELCLKLSNDKLVIEKEFAESLLKGYEIYTNSTWSDDIISKREINELLFGGTEIPSFNSPSGKVILRIAQRFLDTQDG